MKSDRLVGVIIPTHDVPCHPTCVPCLYAFAWPQGTNLLKVIVNREVAHVRKSSARGHQCCAQGYRGLGNPRLHTMAYHLPYMAQGAIGREPAS